jgi:hypothetical protein
MSATKELANGVTITYVDESKKLAADRWLVKLRCRATIPLQGWMWNSMLGEDPRTIFCRERLAGGLAHEIVMERNFIDKTERERLLAEMVCTLEETVLGYIGREAFVRQLFTRKLAESTLHFDQQRPEFLVDDVEEPPGPADFSACFR